MQTPTIHEVAPNIYRISTFVPEVSPEGFTFNQFLVVADEPLLFHTGSRGLFPLVAEAVASIMPIEKLRWLSFGHLEADECGSMNMWLNAAPKSQVAFGEVGCFVSLNDLADRRPRSLAEGEVIDLGGKRVRQISTPHVPHGWEAQVMFEETTRTLLCGDLMTQMGPAAPLTNRDLIEAALRAERVFRGTTPGRTAGQTLRRLAALAPERLAVMHGSSFEGDGRKALLDLAAGLDEIQREGNQAAA